MSATPLHREDLGLPVIKEAARTNGWNPLVIVRVDGMEVLRIVLPSVPGSWTEVEVTDGYDPTKKRRTDGTED